MSPLSTAMGRTLDALAASASDYAGIPQRPPGGRAILDLSVGEVRFPLPEAVRDEAARTLRGVPMWRYSDPRGEPVLREAYLRHLDPPEGSGVLVTAGAKEACWLAIQHAVHRQDVASALVPQPGWEPYALWLRTAGCEATFYDPAALAENPSRMADLLGAASSRVRLLILNYPHNPTGVHVSQAAMDQIMTAAAEADVTVISDEVYRAYAPMNVSAARAPTFDVNRDAIVDSTSKWLASAGLRVGFLTGGPRLLTDATAFRATYASCTSIVTQQLAATLLTSSAAASWLQEVRDQVIGATAALAFELRARGVEVTSHGGLYVWCRAPQEPPAAFRPTTSVPAVHVASGAGFGSMRHVRVCAASEGLNVPAAADAVARELTPHTSDLHRAGIPTGEGA